MVRPCQLGLPLNYQEAYSCTDIVFHFPVNVSISPKYAKRTLHLHIAFPMALPQRYISIIIWLKQIN